MPVTGHVWVMHKRFILLLLFHIRRAHLCNLLIVTHTTSTLNIQMQSVI